MTENEARTIIARALSEIAPEADLASVRPDERLRDAVDLDSFDLLCLVDSLQSLAGVAIPESDYPRMDTLAQLVDYLVAHAA